MKKILIFILIILIIFSFACKKEIIEDSLFQAVITFIMNDVKKNDGANWLNAKLFDKIDVSMIVKTEKLSKTEMNVNNKIRLLLDENTIFIPLFIEKKDIKFSLKEGGVFARIKKLLNKEKFTIMTPNLIIGVRGTDFYIVSDKKGDKLFVREGSVGVKLNIPNINDLKESQNPGIRELYQILNKYLFFIENNEAIYFENEKLNFINTHIRQLLKSQNIEENIKKILDLINIKKINFDPNIFKNALKYFNTNENPNTGKPIYLDGLSNETEIYINNEFVAKGLYAKLFQIGDYNFKFKLKNKEYAINKKITKIDNIQEIIKPDFPKNIIKTQSIDSRRPYEANPEERSAH